MHGAVINRCRYAIEEDFFMANPSSPAPRKPANNDSPEAPTVPADQREPKQADAPAKT
jgi:hypothetical protein